MSDDLGDFCSEELEEIVRGLRDDVAARDCALSMYKSACTIWQRAADCKDAEIVRLRHVLDAAVEVNALWLHVGEITHEWTRKWTAAHGVLNSRLEWLEEGKDSNG